MQDLQCKDIGLQGGKGDRREGQCTATYDIPRYCSLHTAKGVEGGAGDWKKEMQGGPDLSWLSGKFSFFFLFFSFSGPWAFLFLLSSPISSSTSFPYFSPSLFFSYPHLLHLQSLQIFISSFSSPSFPFPYALFEQLFLPLSSAGNLYCPPALLRAALSTARHNCWHTHSTYTQATKNLHSRFGEGGGDKRGALKRRCSILLADLPSFASLQWEGALKGLSPLPPPLLPSSSHAAL